MVGDLHAPNGDGPLDWTYSERELFMKHQKDYLDKLKALANRRR
jgi:hypothetical protein